MKRMKERPELVAVIGDLVNSRGSNRLAAHNTLKAALAALPSDAVMALAPTVGDEIQGVFATAGAAIRSTHLLRLTMLAHNCDIRFGLGLGDVVEIGDGIQDGSAWWHAREGLNSVEELAQTPGWEGVRTGFPDAEPTVLASAQLIDAHISALRPGTCETLLGLLADEPNQDTATRLGISPSANTQRVKSNNLRPLAQAMQALWS